MFERQSDGEMGKGDTEINVHSSGSIPQVSGTTRPGPGQTGDENIQVSHLGGKDVSTLTLPCSLNGVR